MKNAMKKLAELNASVEIADRIIAAINKHGARSVCEAAQAAYSGNKKPIVSMIGDYDHLGIVWMAETAAFAEMSPAEKSDDLKAAAKAFASLGGKTKSTAQTKARRANGAKGGRPKKYRAMIGQMMVGSSGEYVVYGSVRGTIGEHKTLDAAEKTAKKDAKGAKKQGGYSDACIYHWEDDRWVTIQD